MQPWGLDNPPARIRDFVQWYCWDRTNGETLTSFAESRGVTQPAISLMLRDKRVRDLLERELVQGNSGPVRVQAVLDMLHKRATYDEDVKAAKIYLEAVGKMAPRQTQVDVRITDARSLTDGQLQIELQRALALLQNRNADMPEIMEADVVSDTATDTLTVDDESNHGVT